MGIKNFNSILKNINYIKKTTFDKLNSKIIGIDFSLFLYRFIYNNNNPIECFLRQINLLFRHNILPVYVLDGDAPTEKNNILEKRAYKRQKLYEELCFFMNKKNENNSPTTNKNIDNQIIKLEKKSVIFTQTMVQDILYFFEILGIPVIRENEESDFILAQLSKNNKIDYILSDDSDLLVFGAKKVLKNFCIREENFQIYCLDNILDQLNIDYPKFVDMCILCGCDYTPKIKNMNCSKSLQLILQYSIIEEIIKNSEYDINIETIQKARNIFMKNIEKDKLELISQKIYKKRFQFNEIETFLKNHIDKKYLIPIFLFSCHKLENLPNLSNSHK